MSCDLCKHYASVCVDCGRIHSHANIVENFYDWTIFMSGRSIEHPYKYIFYNEVLYYIYILGK